MEDQAVETNDTLTSLVGATEPTLAEGEYFLSENIKGIGEMPEWYKADKYKSVAEQARAYTELEKKFGGFTGAPKDGYELYDGVESDDALWAELVEFGTANNMNQSALHQAWELLTAQEEAVEQVSVEEEISKLGPNAAERITTVEQLMRNNLEPELYEKYRDVVTSAIMIEFIEDFSRSMRPAQLPIDGYVEPGGIEWADIEAEMFRKDENGNLLRSVDMNHERKIQRMMKEYGGDKPYTQTFG
jgi:hypothetical protein